MRVGGCLITRGHGGTRGLQSSMSCAGPRPARPNPQVSTLAGQCPRSSSRVARIKTLGFRPGCSFPFTQHLLTAGNSFGPKKKMSKFYFLCPHTRPCALPSTIQLPSRQQSKAQTRNFDLGPSQHCEEWECGWMCPGMPMQHPWPRTALPVLSAATWPMGNKKTADSINTSVRCSKKKRQLPLLEWEAT